MNCYNHPDKAAVAYCRTCGRALCEQCRRSALGTIFCPEHLPAQAPPPPPPPPPSATAEPLPPPIASAGGTSPGLAFVLGLIPGVGAIYNGQYAKGVVHERHDDEHTAHLRVGLQPADAGRFRKRKAAE